MLLAQVTSLLNGVTSRSFARPSSLVSFRDMTGTAQVIVQSLSCAETRELMALPVTELMFLLHGLLSVELHPTKRLACMVTSTCVLCRDLCPPISAAACVPLGLPCVTTRAVPCLDSLPCEPMVSVSLSPTAALCRVLTICASFALLLLCMLCWQSQRTC
jgi:hypothetical protein